MPETRSTLVLIRSNVRQRVRYIVDGIDRFGVERQLVAGNLAASTESKSEVSGFTIATGQFKSAIQTTIPSLEKCPMLRFFISQFLSPIAQGHQTLFLDLPSGTSTRGDSQCPLGHGHYSNERFPIRKFYIDRQV